MDTTMTAPEPSLPDGPAADAGPADGDRSEQPLSTLRGAGVNVDGRRAGQAVIAVVLLTLLVVGVVLLVAGFNKNAQIDSLRQHGVVVPVKVVGCLGLMGGSGSNLAGYACTGTYTYAGHLYDVSIPGDTLHASGAVIAGVIVPSDPALLSTPSLLAGEHSSSRVFIAPVILLAAFVLAVVALVVRLRRRSASPTTPT